MKKMLTLVTVLIMVMVAQAQTLQSLFEKYSDDERFTYVTVGNGMMNLASSFVGNSRHKKDSKEMVSKMKSIKILTLNEDAGSSIMKSVSQEFDKVILAGKYETAVEARDKGERVHIYYRILGKDNSEMIIMTKDKTEFSVIWISGKMSKEEMLNTFSSNGQVKHKVVKCEISDEKVS